MKLRDDTQPQLRGIIEADQKAGQEGRQRRAEDRRPVHQLHG
jgi:hypothetical protein